MTEALDFLADLLAITRSEDRRHTVIRMVVESINPGVILTKGQQKRIGYLLLNLKAPSDDMALNMFVMNIATFINSCKAC